MGPSRWHVTLRFLGDVDHETTDQLARAVVKAAAAHPTPLECRLGPGTAWYTAVRVLYLPASGVDGLAHAIRAATIPLVPEPEEAPPFHAHLTLARSKGRRLGAAALGAMANIPLEADFAVEAVDLVASAPSPEGHVYTTVARAPLGTASAAPGVKGRPPGTG